MGEVMEKPICNMALRSAVFEALRLHDVSEDCFAEVAAITHEALTTAQAEIEALRAALHDAICMIGHAMPMDTTVLAGRRLVALEVWQSGHDLLNPKHNKDAI